jgi:hypothetical protein
MAQGIRSTPATAGRRTQGRSPSRPKAAAKATAPKKPATAPAPSARAISKDDLRAQVEKLERANAALRTKSREANKAAKVSAARIAELEAEVDQLQQSTTARRSPRPRRQSIDPGDAVPPGVAPQTPAPPDQEVEAARDNLEKHPGEDASSVRPSPDGRLRPVPPDTAPDLPEEPPPL